MRAPVDFQGFYQMESRRLVLWLPVLLGTGIWIYFRLPSEPAWGWTLVWAVPLGLIVSGAARRAGWVALGLAWIAFAVAAGLALAIVSAWLVAAPVVPHPIGETVEGRVLTISRSASGAPRLLIDDVVIYGVEPDETPERLRLTVLEGEMAEMPVPGRRVRVYASLLPTGEPVEPGAFDFRRRAFFARLGGIGLTRGELLILPMTDEAGPVDRLNVWLARVRDAISRHLREVLPGRQGAFAAAIIVGDRADIAEEDAEALRASNLAHLLAISGLHMGMLTGLVFALARLSLAAVPWTAYRISTKKGAALAALMAGAAYLALSGATIATQRAFVMVGVALVAVLVDRPAITLRALAVAATIILVVRPISLLDAGFQMSFAATAALVAGFEALRGWRARRETERRERTLPWRLVRLAGVYVAALAFTSLLAGAATAPISAYHFNRTAPYGLIANLLALPVMGAWIAPMACLAAVLAPLGLSGPALRAMGIGIEHVLDVAHRVASLPGAVQPVRAAPPEVLVLMAFGGLWLVIWRGPWRLAGVLGVFAGMALWSSAPPRPDLLVAPQARLIGMMGPEGRALDHDRAQSFAAETWLRRDGDPAPQPVTAERPGLEDSRFAASGAFANGWRLEIRAGRPEPADLAPLCQPRTLLIARNGPPLEGPCIYYGRDALAESGALAVSAEGDGLTIREGRDASAARLWGAQR